MRIPHNPVQSVGVASVQALRHSTGMVLSAVSSLRRGLFQVPGRAPGSAPAFQPGASPGIEAHLAEVQSPTIGRFSCCDVGESVLLNRDFTSIAELIAAPRPAGARLRWINVDGLHPQTIAEIATAFGLDTLTAEDILNTHERPKCEFFSDHLLVTLRQIYLHGEQLKNEKLSLVCFKDTLISFQEVSGDVFDPIRRRMELPTARFRSYGSEYLLYALIDCISDHLYPLLERYDTALDTLEELAAELAAGNFQHRLFALKRELSLQRRILWSMREVIDTLCRTESSLVSNRVKSFLKDVRDQVNHQIDLLESFRETCGSLLELHHATASSRLNEIMKVLTIMASFFIPTTFVAGVYGMNFTHIPELDWPYAYPVFWGASVLFFLSLGAYFYRKGWIFSRSS